MESFEEVIEYLYEKRAEISSLARFFGTKNYEIAVMAFIARSQNNNKPSNKGRVGRSILRKVPMDLWLDHCIVDGEKLISEPYNVGLKSLEKIIAFCKNNDLTVNISGDSYHYPSRTVRIEFEKNKHN